MEKITQKSAITKSNKKRWTVRQKYIIDAINGAMIKNLTFYQKVIAISIKK